MYSVSVQIQFERLREDVYLCKYSPTHQFVLQLLSSVLLVVVHIGHVRLT